MTKFMIFDIKKFYTSVKKELPGHSINFAKQHITINKQDLKIIQYSRKLLLCNQKSPLPKKTRTFFILLWTLTMGLKFVN